MSELRQDPCTRDWVVIAPRRGHRLLSVVAHPQLVANESCPFCPGNESMTLGEHWRLEDANAQWQVRVVPNLFPVLEPDGSPRREEDAVGLVKMAGIGHHEVIIESPDHAADLATVDVHAVRGVLEAYRARYRALALATRGVVLLFRNHGPGAGSTLTHPHSQIVATPIVPIQVRHRFDVAIQHYDDLGTCLYLDVLNREQRDGRRIVYETEDFVAFQPFASTAPHETWIMPRWQQPSFGDVSDTALDALAPALRDVLAGLWQVLDDLDYNLMILSAPVGDEQRDYFIWHIRIVPRMSTPAGFELGTGMAVNSMSPEESAPLLRAAIAHNQRSRTN